MEGDPDCDHELVLFECEAMYLVNIWKKYSTKPVFKSDFLRLLHKGHPYPDVQIDIQWLFNVSHWASESSNHKGKWDINSSGVFANHYDKIHDQCLLYLAKQQAGIEEQQEREAEKKERDAQKKADADEEGMPLAEFLNSAGSGADDGSENSDDDVEAF
jgi:hypothetical protein